MALTDCPGCKTAVTGRGLMDGAVLTCARCGYVGIWDSGESVGWRQPTTAEHAGLMRSETYLQVMQYNLSMRAWAERDEVEIQRLVQTRLEQCTLRPPYSRLLAADITKDLIDAGFHTHPNETELSDIEQMEELGDEH